MSHLFTTRGGQKLGPKKISPGVAAGITSGRCTAAGSAVYHGVPEEWSACLRAWVEAVLVSCLAKQGVGDDERSEKV